ncbi:hypothetical protein [Mycobacterium sp. KBS0706]|uniref:hypothetical protein n=1 Tax=Mycobacterium sp. KBS0706 TaxID=2578109 RepID=UPI00163DB344|nr:hypothetical protein [Mycobacterium sp. KBS0706]
MLVLHPDYQTAGNPSYLNRTTLSALGKCTNAQADRSDMAAYIIEKAAGRGPLYLVEIKGEKPIWSPELRRARRFSSWEAAVDAVAGLREIFKDLSEDYLVIERR